MLLISYGTYIYFVNIYLYTSIYLQAAADLSTTDDSMA